MKANALWESMKVATSLTQAGRLAEATALIQRCLQGDHSAAQPNGGVDLEVIDVPFTEVDGRDHAPATPLDESEPTGTTPRPATELFGRAAVEPASLWRARPLASRSFTGTSEPHVPQTGRFIAGSFTNAAGTRAYKLFVPSRYVGQPLPLIVMLHGCKQSPDDFANGTRMNAGAEERDCFVLYPAQARSANPSGCWNWFRREDQARDQGEPSIVAGMTRHVSAEYGLDAGKVFAAGLSAGGAMAAVLAVTYPELFAAIGVHSGLACGSAEDLPSALSAMRGLPQQVGSMVGGAMPAIVFHGDRDRTVHPRNGEHVVRAMRNETDATRVTVERGHVPGGHAYTRTVHRDGAERISLEYWVIHGGGHAWSGGKERGSYCDPRGPDATAAMLRFFLQR